MVLIDNIAQYLEAGYSLIPLKAKIPITKNWLKIAVSRESLINYVEQGYNIGCRLSQLDLVIDVDNHGRGSDGVGLESLAKLEEAIGYNLSTNCPSVVTGSGGYHFYMKLPPDVKIKEVIDAYPGIEFKSYGRQVVIPGSIHPETLELYVWKNTIPLNQSPTATKELLAIIQKSELVTNQCDCDKITNDQLNDLLSQLPVNDFADHD